jgi:hypothetical protein
LGLGQVIGLPLGDEGRDEALTADLRLEHLGVSAVLGRTPGDRAIEGEAD